jgi:cytochrome bd-type quinol oxidase subunit 2
VGRQRWRERRSSTHSEVVAEPRRTRAPAFWITWSACAILVVPSDWVTLWSRDDAPQAAQTAVLLGGLVATTAFLLALAALQALALRTKSSFVQTARNTYEKALAYTGIGVLVGTTLVFLKYDGTPEGIKLTSVLSDAATVGGITGLLACLPHNLHVIATTTRRMWREHPSRAVQLLLILAIVAYLLVKQAVKVLG